MEIAMHWKLTICPTPLAGILRKVNTTTIQRATTTACEIDLELILSNPAPGVNETGDDKAVYVYIYIYIYLNNVCIYIYINICIYIYIYTHMHIYYKLLVLAGNPHILIFVLYVRWNFLDACKILPWGVGAMSPYC